MLIKKMSVNMIFSAIIFITSVIHSNCVVPLDSQVQPPLPQSHSVFVTETVPKIISEPTSKWNATFDPYHINLSMDTKEKVFLEITNVNTSQSDFSFYVRSEDEHLAFVDLVIPVRDVDPISKTWRGNITVEAVFLGKTKIYVELVNMQKNQTEQSPNKLYVIIVRKVRAIDTIFTSSVVTLVSLLYINFGAALDLSVLRGLITYPVGPAIGLFSQFLVMPILSYVLGYYIFHDFAEMQLGLFMTGVSPGGGASNIWAVVLGGNINLSVLMTTIGNIAAFGMMPLWLFTLGSIIFERNNMKVPYTKIATFAVGLVVPLAIGLAIQKWSPRFTRILVRLLKPLSIALILFIIIFAIITNLYIFQLFSWQIVVAGCTLPWFGYLLAWTLAKCLRQSAADALTIAIETGVQNTAIAIFMLRFSLDQPQADLTTVVPVAVAIMTPFPLLGMYLFKRFNERNIKPGIREEENFVRPHDQQNNENHIS